MFQLYSAMKSVAETKRTLVRAMCTSAADVNLGMDGRSDGRVPADRVGRIGFLSGVCDNLIRTYPTIHLQKRSSSNTVSPCASTRKEKKKTQSIERRSVTSDQLDIYYTRYTQDPHQIDFFLL